MRALFAAGLLTAVVGAPPTMAQSGKALPVLLIHGLWSSCSTWNAIAGDLVALGWKEAPTVTYPFDARRGTFLWSCTTERRGALTGSTALPVVLGESAEDPMLAQLLKPLAGNSIFMRLTFESSDGQSFEVQGRQVADAIRKLREITGAAKVVVVGHSMGGLAARAYLQGASYRDDVAALITVDTPHGGSALGMIPREEWPPACKVATFVTGRSTRAKAVQSLIPGSSELAWLNEGRGAFGLMPFGISTVAFIGKYVPNELPERSKESCIRSYQDASSRFLSKVSRDLPVGAGRGSPGISVAAIDKRRLESDGIVTRLSQNPFIALVFGEHNVEVIDIDGFHTEVHSEAGTQRGLIVEAILRLSENTSRAIAAVPEPTMTATRPNRVLGSVQVRHPSVEFRLWDSGQIDGDRVALYVNDKIVVADLTLTGQRQTVPLVLEPGDNVVVLVALNEGRISPNTAALEVSDGERVQQLILKSDMRTNAAYRVTVQGAGVRR